MIKIGDFSKLSRVSVKTLRYYDELGLLQPVEIDRFSGYRYYSLDQLPRLNRILAFKDLGLSLEQIKGLLDENLPAGHIRGMLRLKQAEIEHHVQEEQERLKRVEARLRLIEQEDVMTPYEIVLKRVEPQWVASVRGVIPNYDESGPIFDRLFDRAYGYVYHQGIKKVGCGIAIYHDSNGQAQGIEVEACAPVYEKLQPGQDVLVYELPAVESMASVVHHGPFATISLAYKAMLAWIEQNGYRITGPTREVYLQYERGGDQSKYVTEIQFPVSK